MFALEPLDTSNLISLLQLLAVAVGFYFSWQALQSTRQSIKNSTDNAQATLFNNMVTQGRDLQHKYAEIYFPNKDSSADMAARKDQFTGTLISYYAACFELRSIVQLPDTIARQYDADLGAALQDSKVREKYEGLKHQFSKDFNHYVGNLRGV